MRVANHDVSGSGSATTAGAAISTGAALAGAVSLSAVSSASLTSIFELELGTTATSLLLAEDSFTSLSSVPTAALTSALVACWSPWVGPSLAASGTRPVCRKCQSLGAAAAAAVRCASAASGSSASSCSTCTPTSAHRARARHRKGVRGCVEGDRRGRAALEGRWVKGMAPERRRSATIGPDRYGETVPNRNL
eukprot:3098003-Pleurochrysis_carterae.AAC.2